jgi:hypothetical protein
MAIWHSAQVNTIDVLKTKPLIIGSFSKGHLTYPMARDDEMRVFFGHCPRDEVPDFTVIERILRIYEPHPNC